MTTDTLVGGNLTSPCVRVTPAILARGVLGPSSRSMASSSALRRAKTKKKKGQGNLFFFCFRIFIFLKTYLRKKIYIVVVSDNSCVVVFL